MLPHSFTSSGRWSDLLDCHFSDLGRNCWQCSLFSHRGLFPLTFTHFFVEFCRDRRLRAFSKNFKILASSLFSFPCLSQILSTTPAQNLKLRHCIWQQGSLFLILSYPGLFKNIPHVWFLRLYSLIKNPQHDFPKMRGGVKGRSELFRKFIRFGRVRLPLALTLC